MICPINTRLRFRARGSLKGPWGLAERTGRAVTSVAEHALHQEARVVGAAAAAAVVLAGVGAQQTVTAGALKGWGGHPPRQTAPQSGASGGGACGMGRGSGP